MKKVVIVGNGISGMSCAIHCAKSGIHVFLAAPAPSEQAQSVMAAGGINAVLSDHEEGDSVLCHIDDTIKGGAYLGEEAAVHGLCEHAEDILRELESLGTVFTTEKSGRFSRRAFGGQSFRRTCYCGSCTGKQIVSAMIMEVRRYESQGMIRRSFKSHFHSALIRDGICYGVLLFNDKTKELEEVYADALVMATGGQNALFGKTTGSTLCDGYAAGRLFLQGAELKNLEFIQYHPTTLETAQKKMLITEAVRGEGGRLFYLENGERVYFMEEKYGKRGNLMTRDIVSREIAMTGREVFLDISFLDKKTIEQRLLEVFDLCRKYRGIDISKEPIPVTPSVHFFMGGLAVHLNHETNIRNLFAVGECASLYHGANRLGGNSLLAAYYSGTVAAEEILSRKKDPETVDFSHQIREEKDKLAERRNTKSTFPELYVQKLVAECINKHLGIVRDEASLTKGIEEMDYYLSVEEKLRYDDSVPVYNNYSLNAIMQLAKAMLLCARERRESRGAHFRSDYPETDPRFAKATLISYDDGAFRVRLDEEKIYES